MSHRPAFQGRRIVIVGDSCSGKSTLAASLAAVLGLACVELDALFWLPNWQEPQPEDFRRKVREALAAAPDGWVVAGNYRSRTHDLTWAAADTMIWLDLPLHLTVTRIVCRSWRRSRSKELLWGTNYEKFWPQFKIWQDEALIGFALKHHRSRRADMAERMAAAVAAGSPRWYRVRSARGADRLLERARGQDRAIADG